MGAPESQGSQREWGETFHLVKFLPGRCLELWSLPLPAGTRGDLALRQEPGNGTGVG